MKLGDEQFAKAGEWESAGRLALCGIGVEPGLSDVFARYAADHLFSEIDELGVRDGANLTVDGYDFAPSFSIWTTIEECLNPPVVWEKGRDWFTTEPFSEPEVFDFPEGIGPVECVNVEHEEVLLMPRWVDARRVTFKYGLGDEFIDVLKTLHKLGLDRTDKVRVGGVEVSPRDVVAACLPDPATLGDKMRGKTCAGLWVTGTGKDGRPRSTYLYHVVDNEWSMQEYGHQCVVWQTAVNPVVALELLATGDLGRQRRARPRGLRRAAVPRPPHRLRLPLGHPGALTPRRRRRAGGAGGRACRDPRRSSPGGRVFGWSSLSRPPALSRPHGRGAWLAVSVSQASPPRLALRFLGPACVRPPRAHARLRRVVQRAGRATRRRTGCGAGGGRTTGGPGARRTRRGGEPARPTRRASAPGAPAGDRRVSTGSRAARWVSTGSTTRALDDPTRWIS